MKKIKYLFLLIVPLLSGCYNERELNEIAITTAVSVDYKDENFNIIAEVVNPTKQQDAASANNSPFVNYYSSAPTLGEAFRNVVTESPRQLYGSQIEIIIISETVAKEHIAEVLEYFSRSPEIRSEVKIIVAKTDESIKSITFQRLLADLSSSNILNSLEVQNKVLSLSSVYTLNDVLSMYLNPYQELSLPTIKIYGDIEDGNEKENVTTSTPKALSKLEGSSVFKDNKLVGYLDTNESIMFNFIIGEIKETVIDVKYKDDNIVFEPHNIESKTKVNIKNNSVDIEIKGQARVNEFDVNANLKDPKEVNKIKQALNKNLEKKITDTFNSIREKYNSDIFGFREMYYKDNPKYYKKHYHDKWYEEVFPKLKFNIKSDIKLYQKGNTIGGIEYENKDK